MSFRTILALTDLSDASTAGLALADSFARRVGAVVVVGYVHETIGSARHFPSEVEQDPVFAERVRADAEKALEELSQSRIGEEHRIGAEIVDSQHTRDGILKLVKRTAPDLICMASHGRSGIRHLLLGSIAEFTIRKAGKPVFVTKDAPVPLPPAPLRVLLALDLSGNVEATVRRVATFLGPDDEILLTHVVEPAYPVPVSPAEATQPAIPDLSQACVTARRRLEMIELEQPAPQLAVRVETGPVRHTLRAVEEDYSPHLLIARTHGHGPFDRMMLGSVAEFLARRAAAPVLIYPK